MERRVIEGDLTTAQRAGRCELRMLAAGGRPPAVAEVLVLPGYDGPLLPPRLPGARLELDLRQGVRGCLSAGAEQYHFAARELLAFQHSPALFAPLHAAFALGRRERWVAGLLLKALRLPGGPRLLRAWHARRR